MLNASPRTRRLAVAVLAGLVSAAPVSGQSAWINSNSNFSWNDPLNWSAGLPTSTVLAQFSNAGSGSPITLDANQAALGLSFTNSTPYVFNEGSVTGATLTTFSSGITSSTAGAVTINPKLVLGAAQSWSLTNSGGSLTVGPVDLATFALTIGATNVGPINFTGPVTGTGTGTVLNIGGGTVTFSAASTFAGNIQVNGGTLALSGGNDRLPVGSSVTFNNTAGTLALGANNQTHATIGLTTVVGSATAATGTVTGTGTLTLNGPLLQIGPAGALTANPVHTLTMTGLSNFVFNNSAGVIRVGLASGTTNSAALGQVATWNMASSNTVTAATFAMGDVGASNDGGISTVNLGQTNNLNLTTLNIANTRSDATMKFNTGLTNPTFTLRGLTGGTTSATTLNIGGVNTFQGAGQTAFTSALDLTGGVADVNVSTVNLGFTDTTTGTTRVGTTNASITVDAGTFNVTNLNLGRLAGTGTIGTQNLVSNTAFNQNGAASVVNATTVTLAQNVITATGNTRTLTATYNLNGGTLRATTIQRGANTGNATVTARLNWANGTIENTAGSDLSIPDVGIVLAAGTHTFNATGANSINLGTGAVISGIGFGISKTGSGTLLVNSPNTYTGTTSIGAGTVRIAGTGALGSSAPLSMSGGLFDLNGLNTTVGALSGAGGTIANNTAATTSVLTVNAAAGNTTFAGTLADNTGTGGALAVTKSGTGTVSLGGTNGYTGSTIVNAGTLVFSSAYPNSSSLTVATGATFSLVSNSATAITVPALSLGTGASGTSTLGLELGTVALSDSISTAASATTANNIRFDITSLTGFGAGSYTLLSAAGGLGGTTTYQIGAFPSGFGYTLTPSATSVVLNVFAITPTTGNIYFTGVNPSWAAVSAGNSQTFSSDLAGTTAAVGTPNSTNTINFNSTAGTVTGPTITTTLDGLFTVNDVVFNSNTQSGTVTSIAIQPGNAPTNTLTISPAASTDGIAMLAGAPALVSISAPIAVGAAQTWTVTDAASVLSISGTLTGTAGLTKSGLGTVRFSDTAMGGFTGGINVAAGTVQFDAASAAISVSGNVGGPGAVVKTGANALTLSGNNTFAGGTSLAAGTLNLATATALGTGALTIEAGTTLANTAATALTMTNNNAMVWNGNFSKTGLDLDFGSGGATFSADRTVTVSANNLIIGGVVNGGTAALTKAGTGVLTLTNTANTYSGSTTIAAGVLAVAKLDNSGVSSSIGTGTALNFTSGTLRYLGAANGVSNRTVAIATAATVDFANATTDLTLELSGVISGAGTLTKNSSLTTPNNSSNLILSGVNTFTGNVTVSNGNLTITNSSSLGTGTKTVALTAGTSGAPSLRLDPGVTNSIVLPATIGFSTSFNGSNPSNPGALGAIDSRTGTNTIAGNFTLTSGGGSTAFFVASGSSLTMSGGIAPNTTGRTLDLRGDGVGRVTGVIADGSATNTLSLNRNGSGGGVWTLSGANTYTLGTTISSGTLLVANTTGSGTGTGAVNVNGAASGAAATLFGGTGRVTGLVNVNVTTGVTAATIRAGNESGIGTLELAGGLNVASGGRLSLRVTDGSTPATANTGLSTLGTLPNPTSNNFLRITGGTTTINTGAVVVVDATGANFTPFETYSYLVGQGAGTQNLSITNPSQFVLSGFAFEPTSVSFTANNAGNLYLNMTFPVPEPSSLAAVAMGGMLLMRRRRRR